MNLRDKLRAVGGTGGKGPSGAERPVSTDCRHVAVTRPPEEFPGALELKTETLRLMTDLELPERLDPRKILYLDTETTGLGGSGTVAFLVGMGWLTDQGFEVHQFLMRDYPEEKHLLKHVSAGLQRFDALCTFNGSTFDVPLLESRFLINRMSREGLDLPHIDLLRLARRLWKLRLGRCNLGRLEEVILGQPREEDLPGSEVPQRYFTYLKTGRPELLDDVLRHNAQDIATLCVLLNHMARLYERPEEIRFSEDVYAMGRALEKGKHTENARRCYRLARPGKMGDSAGLALARSYRRGGDREEAARIWREMIASRRGGVTPYIELAKYEEHIRRDIPAALRLTEQAIALTAEPSVRDRGAVQDMKNELQYRYQRLKRKEKELRSMGFTTGLKANKAYRIQQKGDKQEAMRLYEECFNEGLNDARYTLAYALLLIRDGQYEKAKAFLVKHQKAYGMTPDQRTTLIVDYSVCCAKLGQIDKGISKMEEQFRKTPTGLLYQTLGYLLIEKYDQSKKEAFLAEAATATAAEPAPEADPIPEAEPAGALPGVEGAEAPAKALTPEEQWTAGVEKAVAFNKSALEYDDEDPVCLDNMGQLYYRVLGDKAAAKEWFEKAIAVKDGQIDTLYFLSRYDLDDGNRAAALEKLEKASEGRFSPLNYRTKQEIDAEIAQLKGE